MSFTMVILYAKNTRILDDFGLIFCSESIFSLEIVTETMLLSLSVISFSV